jgi:5-methylcytosine-specific restriction endonuclease McrA
MKNLTPLTQKMSYWDDIVNNKHLASRTPLQAIRVDVSKRFTAYTQLTNPITLETIPSSTFVAPHAALLNGCYSNSNGLSFLKTKIKEKQNVLLRNECQYCNIGEPNTFDHYLPQVDFPEFSALSINLIPCCSTCNSSKGICWRIDGRRKIINLYYDTLPNVSYLTCSIVYRNNVPQADFNVMAATIPENMRTEITTHFSTLHLTERYKGRSNSEITDVFTSIQPLSTILSRLQIQNQLRTDAANMKVSKGDNYWRAVLKIALSNSNRFLTDAGY